MRAGGWGPRTTCARPSSTWSISDAVRQAQLAGKCFDTAMKEIKLPKYEKWRNYDAYLPGNIERFCEFWGGGI